MTIWFKFSYRKQTPPHRLFSIRHGQQAGVEVMNWNVNNVFAKGVRFVTVMNDPAGAEHGGDPDAAGLRVLRASAGICKRQRLLRVHPARY